MRITIIRKCKSSNEADICIVQLRSQGGVYGNLCQYVFIARQPGRSLGRPLPVLFSLDTSVFFHSTQYYSAHQPVLLILVLAHQPVLFTVAPSGFFHSTQFRIIVCLSKYAQASVCRRQRDEITPKITPALPGFEPTPHRVGVLSTIQALGPQAQGLWTQSGGATF